MVSSVKQARVTPVSKQIIGLIVPRWSHESAVYMLGNICARFNVCMLARVENVREKKNDRHRAFPCETCLIRYQRMPTVVNDDKRATSDNGSLLSSC